jgi:hypothetical protein
MSSSCHKNLLPRISLIILVITGIALPAYCERKYFLGTTMDFVGGASNQVGTSSFSLERLDQGITPFYSIYPSLSLKSVGKHSQLDLKYTFSGDYYQSTPRIFAPSHDGGVEFTGLIGAKTHLRLSDHFTTMPDFSTINVLKGINTTPQGFNFAFEPQLYKSSSINNNATMGLDIDLTSKSSLVFSGSGSFRRYNRSISQSYLSDQSRAEGSVGFSHKHSSRTKWTLKYLFRQNDYQNYDTARTHSATLALSRVLSTGFDITLEAGPAYVELEHYTGYIVNVNLSKQFRDNRFYAAYSHNVGDSTGIGGSSENHQGSLGFSHFIGRTISINFDATAFRQSQRKSSAYDYRGVSGSAALSKQLGKYWVASIGISYRTDEGKAYSNYQYKRAYFSIGYRFPELWKTEK